MCILLYFVLHDIQNTLIKETFTCHWVMVEKNWQLQTKIFKLCLVELPMIRPLDYTHICNFMFFKGIFGPTTYDYGHFFLCCVLGCVLNNMGSDMSNYWVF
jgi:hypothetical protein